MSEPSTSGSWRRGPAGRRATLERWLRAGWLAAALPLVFSGCSTASFLRQSTMPGYKPSNVYREELYLPPNIKRVAVLPLTTLTADAAADFGREVLEQVLFGELGRSRLFELVEV